MRIALIACIAGLALALPAATVAQSPAPSPLRGTVDATTGQPSLKANGLRAPSEGWTDADRSADAVAREKAFARRYLDTDGAEMHWTLIRATLASVANTVLVPMQDVLGLGSEARMNLPGRQAGNWGFRFTWAQLTPAITERLHALTSTSER